MKRKITPKILYVHPEVHAAIKAAAAKDGRSMVEFLRRMFVVNAS